MRLKLLFLLFCLSLVQMTIAQRTVSGVVTDADNGETLIGANVIIKGTTAGTITDFNGNFSLQVPDDAKMLTISYTGYAEQEVSIEGGISNVTIVLSQGAVLGEVVVTALGLVEKKERITYAAQRLSSKDLNVSRVGDVSQQLSGQVAGLDITTNNGSQPLIVVDGALISNTYIGIGTDAHNGNLPIDYGNSLTDLNPDDFEDITVLKGPKAAALYGSRASNGVLIIRTKSGQYKEGLGVEFSTGASMEQVNQFWDEQFDYGGGGFNSANGLYNQYRSNWGGSFGPLTDGAPVVQATPEDPSPSATPFVQKADRKGFFDTGVNYNNNLAFSFSNDKSRGRLSFGNLNKKGIIPNTDYNKTNVSLRMGFDVTDKLTVDVASNYINSGSDNVPEIGYAFGEGLMFQMLWVMKNFDLDDYRDYWLPGQEYQQQSYFLSWGVNPHLLVNENLNAFNHNRVFGNIKANYKFSDNLTGFVRASVDNYDDLRTSQKASGQPTVANGRYREQNVGLTEENYEFYLTYSKPLNTRIDFEANVGGNIYKQDIANKITETRNRKKKFIVYMGRLEWALRKNCM